MRAVSGRWVGLLAVGLVAAAVATGCGGPKEDPILLLSAAESLAQGKELFEREKYADARKYFSHAFEVEPNSAIGREALLLAADTLYLQGSNTNLIQAEAKYRDFLNRFPTSDRGAYVQYQIGNTLFEQIREPDRDQTATHEALDAYAELLRLYATSEYAAKAEERIDELRRQLAEHELLVGKFYFRYGLPQATISRLEYLMDNYPEYPDKEEVYYFMGMAHRRRGEGEEAQRWFKMLREEYPQGERVRDLPKSAEEKG